MPVPIAQRVAMRGWWARHARDREPELVREPRLTLFVEGINILNRPNVRFSLPTVNRRTFEAVGLLDTMVPLIPSVGILLEF